MEETIQTEPLTNSITSLGLREVREGEEEPHRKGETADHAPSDVTSRLAAEIAAIQGSGQPLPPSERAFFERRFGLGFRHVRVHTGRDAAEAAAAVKAQAFTLGWDVVFGAGRYAPQCALGRRLIAHELVHVVQQVGQSGMGLNDTPLRDVPGIDLAMRDDLTGLAENARPVAEGLIQRRKPETKSGDIKETDLIAAVRSGDAKTVKRLVKKGADVNQQDEFDNTPLIYAVDRGEVSTVELLIQNGADLEILSSEEQGLTALKVATLNDAPDMVALLLQYGADMDTRDSAGLNAPSWAAREGKIEPLLRFLQHGLDINWHDPTALWEGYTLLMHAAEGCQLEMVKWLLQNGADPTSVIKALAQTERIKEAYEWQQMQTGSLVIPNREGYEGLQQQKDEKLEKLEQKITQCNEVIEYLRKVLEQQHHEPKPPSTGTGLVG